MSRPAAALVSALAAGLTPVLLLALGGFVIAAGGASPGFASGQAEHGAAEPPSSFAFGDIPPAYLDLYRAAASMYGLDWAILAAIGKVECDHGRGGNPCSREGSVNAAGAGGPMQFLAATWSDFAVDGDGDGRRDRWDPADAIFSAARYLRASGAPGDYRSAIFAYNHADSYVAEVESWAGRYRGASTEASLPVPAGSVGAEAATGGTTTAVMTTPGQRATLDPHDGHLALVPADAPPVVQAMVVAGNELQRLAYGPAGHPDPRGVTQEDCSSAVNYVLYRAGVRPIGEILRRNPLAQDYVSWGEPGPGRWVTIYAADSPTPHVFIVIAGLRLDTSHRGTDIGPNRDEDGPRWRILDHIPTWARWSVRHPPGL